MKTEQNQINIAVLVSGGGTNLQALINAERKGLLHSGKIALVISSRADAYALKRAEKAGIQTALAVKSECGGQAGMEARICALLSDYSVDLIILAGFMSILSGDFTSRFDHRILNVHPSLIPAFCGEGFYGLRVHRAALEKGVKVTGATVHYVNEIPDGGEIILQKAVRVCDGDTPEMLQKRVMRLAEWKILPAAAELVSEKILKEKENHD